MVEEAVQPTTSLLADREPSADQVIERLRKAQRVLIGTHEHPDGDAVGSALALMHALTMQGKEVTVFVPDLPPEMLQFLPGSDHLTTHKPAASTFDAVVVVDATNTRRAHLEHEVANHPNSIVIDHHEGNPEQGTLNIVIPEAAATAHILTELFRTHDVPLTRDIATCLLTGIFTDTGSFMHDSTSPEILDIASLLMQRGARLAHIAHETYQRKDLPSLRIWGQALSRVMVSEETGAAVSIIRYDDLKDADATLDDLSGVVNMLNTLPDTRFALLLIEHEPGKIKGSLRSEPHKQVDVARIAKRLGGGGHTLASGFELDGHIEQRDGTWRIVAPHATQPI